MRQINFLLLFGLALLTVYFTLENTAQASVNILPGVSTSLPLAVLLVLASGIGAFGAWLFSSWNGMLKNVNERYRMTDLEQSQQKVKELQAQLDELQSKRKVLPFMKLKDEDKKSAAA